MKNYLYLIIVVLFLGCNSTQKKEQKECISDNSSLLVSKAHFPEWSANACIYEVNVRQYTPEGTFEAFSEHLPRLQQMGVKILWIMPIYPIAKINRKGTLGSYYAISDYKAVNPEFGNFNDFKKLVEEAHSMGFKVILEWVANHTGWDGPWITTHSEWYTQDEIGNIVSPVEDWSDVADLNYTVPKMREAMIDAMEYWVSEADIDGYRCDVAGMVPVGFWEEARARLDNIKPIIMLAEDEDEPALLENAFNINYGWSFHHLMNKIAQGKAGVADLKQWFADTQTTYPIGSYAMNFTSNHDENSWNGTEYERMGDAVKTMAALTFVIPGIPLIYSGQEASLNKRLEFFEKDEIDWSKLDMQLFYSKLIEAKANNNALWNGCAGAKIKFVDMKEENNLLVFVRQTEENKVLAIFNLSDSVVKNTFNDKKVKGKYSDVMTNKTLKISSTDNIEVDPWEFMILIEE